MGDVSATVAQEMMLAWNTLNDANDRVYLSLHSGELTATDGEWSNANELSGGGYARLLVPLTAFADSDADTLHAEIECEHGFITHARRLQKGWRNPRPRIASWLCPA